MVAPLAAPGRLIAERYRLEQCLSSGAQGSLWRASDQLAFGPGPLQLQIGATALPLAHQP